MSDRERPQRETLTITIPSDLLELRHPGSHSLWRLPLELDEPRTVSRSSDTRWGQFKPSRWSHFRASLRVAELTRPVLRLLSPFRRLSQDQIRRDHETTLRQRFAVLDYGLPPTTTSLFGPGLPITVLPNPGDPIGRLWQLPARKQAPSTAIQPDQRNHFHPRRGTGRSRSQLASLPTIEGGER
jgi:hypothetical protein